MWIKMSLLRRAWFLYPKSLPRYTLIIWSMMTINKSFIEKIIKSAFLVVLAHIKMNIAQNNMTKSLLVTSITGHNIAKNKARDSRSVAKVQTSFFDELKDPLKAQFWPADIPPTLCTHIIYAFADIPEGNNTIVPTEWNDISILYPAVMEIRSVFRSAPYSALIGWNSKNQSGKRIQSWKSCLLLEVGMLVQKDFHRWLQQKKIELNLLKMLLNISETTVSMV